MDHYKGGVLKDFTFWTSPFYWPAYSLPEIQGSFQAACLL